MLLGKELEAAIHEMGLVPNSFAKLIGVSQTAVLNWINNPNVEPKDKMTKRVEEILRKRCRCCGQYTEKENAWSNQTAKPNGGGGRGKA